MREISQLELNDILDKHKKWLNGEEDGKRANLSEANLRGADLCEADLCEANLCEADLREADLREANLRGADLSEANLRGANLDFSCLPLRCGGLKWKTDKCIMAQLAYHFCSAECEDDEVKKAQNAILGLANQFHRVNECGALQLKEVNE